MIYALAFFTTVLLVSLAKLHRFRELHHGYYGMILGFTAVFLGWHWLAQWAGLVLLLDDAIQHADEALGQRDRMADFTPIHNVGAWLMKLDWKGWAGAALAIIVMAAAAVYFAQRAMP